MEKFGSLLRTYRRATYYPATNKRLSQTQFADELRRASGIEYSYGTISQWERSKLKVGQGSRFLLLSIIKVLVKFNTTYSLEDANALLRSAEYRPLNDQEIAQINQRWVKEQPKTYLLPPESTQQAALPAKIVLIGRQETTQAIKNSLLDPQNKVSFIVARGGVGKTAIATTLAWEHLESDQFESIVWLPFGASADVAPETMLADLTLQLGEWMMAEGLDRSNAKMRAKQIKGVLSELKHLVVVDGVESAEHSDYLGQHLWELAGNSKFIVTSRVYPQNPNQTYICEIDELDLEKSGELLHSHAQKSSRTINAPIDNIIVQQIFNHIGGHPLTLGILPELLTKFSLQRILDAIERGKYGAHHEIYAAVWEALSHEARKVLFALCFVSQAGIGEDFIFAVTNLDEDTALDALEELFRYNLLQTRGTFENKLYNLHNLTIQYIKIWLTSLNLDFPKYSILGTIAILTYWQETVSNLDHNQLSSQSLSNIVSACLFSFQKYKSNQLCMIRLSLIQQAHPMMESRGIWHDWKKVLSLSIRLDTEHDKLRRCNLLNKLATLNRLNKNLQDAFTQYQAAWSLATELNNEANLAYAAYGLGVTYLHKFDFQQAIRYCDHAIESFDQLNLPKEFAVTLNLRGLIAFQREEFAMAEDYFKHSVNILKAEESIDNLLSGLNNLARLYKQWGKEEKVIDTYQKIYSVLTIHSNSVREARVKLTEGAFFFDLGNIDKAQQVFRDINLKYLQQTKNHYLVALTHNNLGNVLLKQNRLRDAEEYLLKSISIWHILDDKQELANSLETLGDIHYANGNNLKANKTYRDALKILENLPNDVSSLSQLRRNLKQRIKKTSL